MHIKTLSGTLQIRSQPITCIFTVIKISPDIDPVA